MSKMINKFLLTVSRGNTSSPSNQRSSPPTVNQSVSSNGPMDFSTELANKLTLKRQKQQQEQQPQSQQISVSTIVTESVVRARGPPPQPPIQQKINVNIIQIIQISEISCFSISNRVLPFLRLRVAKHHHPHYPRVTLLHPPTTFGKTLRNSSKQKLVG